MIYRRIAAARTEDELTRIMEEVRDRYGPPPVPVLNLADYGRIRVLADELGVETHRARRLGRRLPLPPEGEGRSGARDRHGPRARRPAAHPAVDAQAGSSAAQATPPRPGAAKPRRSRRSTEAPGSSDWPPGDPRASGASRPGGRRGPPPGEVTPGFSKAEILRPKDEDPRAPGRHPRSGSRSCWKTSKS